MNNNQSNLLKSYNAISDTECDRMFQMLIEDDNGYDYSLFYERLRKHVSKELINANQPWVIHDFLIHYDARLTK